MLPFLEELFRFVVSKVKSGVEICDDGIFPLQIPNTVDIPEIVILFDPDKILFTLAYDTVLSPGFVYETISPTLNAFEKNKFVEVTVLIPNELAVIITEPNKFFGVNFVSALNDVPLPTTDEYNDLTSDIE